MKENTLELSRRSMSKICVKDHICVSKLEAMIFYSKHEPLLYLPLWLSLSELFRAVLEMVTEFSDWNNRTSFGNLRLVLARNDLQSRELEFGLESVLCWLCTSRTFRSNDAAAVASLMTLAGPVFGHARHCCLRAMSANAGVQSGAGTGLGILSTVK
jgi:hypothetical protein